MHRPHLKQQSILELLEHCNPLKSCMLLNKIPQTNTGSNIITAFRISNPRTYPRDTIIIWLHLLVIIIWKISQSKVPPVLFACQKTNLKLFEAYLKSGFSIRITLNNLFAIILTSMTLKKMHYLVFTLTGIASDIVVLCSLAVLISDDELQ